MIMPLYYSLGDDYSLKIQHLLYNLFNLKTNCYNDKDYLKILDNYSINDENYFNNKTYYESKIHLYLNPEFKQENSYDHFIDHKYTEFNHYGYDFNECNIEKIVSGTIFFTKFNLFKQINKDYQKELQLYSKYIESYENIKYNSNFDKNGQLFRYTNAGEYIIQMLIYKYNNYCYGYELRNINDYLNHSICLNGIYERFLIYYDLFNSKNKNDETKENMLIITNELSKTGAPFVLKNILLNIRDKYNIYIISLYQGDDKDYYVNNNYFNFSIFEDYTRLGIEIFEKNVDFLNKCVKLIKPKIIYGNTFVSNFGIYGSIKSIEEINNKEKYNPKIILHVHEAEEEIINLINNNYIISFTF